MGYVKHNAMSREECESLLAEVQRELRSIGDNHKLPQLASIRAGSLQRERGIPQSSPFPQGA